MDEKQFGSRKSARRFLRPRISLCTLLAVMAILCGALAYSALHWRSAKRQEAAADAVKTLGGRWNFMYQRRVGLSPDVRLSPDILSPKQAAWAPEWLRERLGTHFFESVRSISFYSNRNDPNRPRTTDEAMELLQHFPGLRQLGLYSTDVTDRGIEQLEHCPEMQYLSLANNRHITSEAMKSVKKLRRLHTFHSVGPLNNAEGIAHLKEIPQLRELLIDDWRTDPTISNETLKHIGEMKSLHLLSIGSASVTDEGIAHLKEIPELRKLLIYDWRTESTIANEALKHIGEMKSLHELSIRSASVTDEGLAHLENLPQLKQLRLTETKVTPEGVNRLQRALPSCTIY
jgi:Leucine-rich repeat (LRR) protein